MDEKQLVDGATALAEKQSRVIKIEPAEQPQNMLLRVAAYAGNALLQKRYTPDMLSRQQKTNHGEREMYFVPESNDAIISPEIFERAQVLRQKRSLSLLHHGRSKKP